MGQLIDRRGEGIDSIGFTVADVQAGPMHSMATGARMIGSQGG